MQLFNTVANIDLIVEKMPNSEIEKWMEETEGMKDSQLASALGRNLCWSAGAIAGRLWPALPPPSKL
jgi:hypothetical protein